VVVAPEVEVVVDPQVVVEEEEEAEEENLAGFPFYLFRHLSSFSYQQVGNPIPVHFHSIYNLQMGVVQVALEQIS